MDKIGVVVGMMGGEGLGDNEEDVWGGVGGSVKV